MGDRLMEANWSNPRGHFEDMDFVDVHVAVFERLGLDRDGWNLAEIDEFPGDLVRHAHWLVDRNRSRGRAWGWKDPRGTLFARLWCRVIPDAKLAILFRAPWAVVDSLFKRGDAVFGSDPELAVRAWLFYNRCLLRLAVEHPQRCVVANVDHVAADPVGWVRAVESCIGVSLATPVAAVAEPNLLHGAIARAGRGIIQTHYPEAVELYESLHEVAWRPVSLADASSAESDPKLELSEWRDARAIHPRGREADGELEKAYEALERARRILEEIAPSDKAFMNRTSSFCIESGDDTKKGR
jgi:hypothetical protein